MISVQRYCSPSVERLTRQPTEMKFSCNVLQISSVMRHTSHVLDRNDKNDAQSVIQAIHQAYHCANFQFQSYFCDLQKTTSSICSKFSKRSRIRLLLSTDVLVCQPLIFKGQFGIVGIQKFPILVTCKAALSVLRNCCRVTGIGESAMNKNKEMKSSTKYSDDNNCQYTTIQYNKSIYNARMVSPRAESETQ